jgi:hypothetical protein
MSREKHPRFKMHFTPTSSSWLNLVERFFADLTGDVIRAGSFASVKELVHDIKAYLAARNANPKPYKWKAEGETERAAAALACYLLPSVSPVCPRSFAAALRKAATNASSSVGARSETAA